MPPNSTMKDDDLLGYEKGEAQVATIQNEFVSGEISPIPVDTIIVKHLKLA